MFEILLVSALAGVVGFFWGRTNGEARTLRSLPSILAAERVVAFELVSRAFESSGRRSEASIEDVAFMSPWLEEELTRRSLEMVKDLPNDVRALVRSPVRELVRAAIREHRYQARLAWMTRLGLASESDALLGLPSEVFADIADTEMLTDAKGEAIRTLIGEPAPKPKRPPLPPSLK